MKLAQLQKSCTDWCVKCFGWDIVRDRRERNRRFIEESLELVQSLDLPREDVIKLVDHVYSRPKGKTKQELGGVLVTLAVLSESAGENMSVAATVELQRITDKIDEIRARGAKKIEANL